MKRLWAPSLSFEGAIRVVKKSASPSRESAPRGSREVAPDTVLDLWPSPVIRSHESSSGFAASQPPSRRRAREALPGGSSRVLIVAPAERSDAAKQKDATRRTSSGHPVQSFQDLLKDMATLCRSKVRLVTCGAEFEQLTVATEYQRHVLSLLEVAT